GLHSPRTRCGLETAFTRCLCRGDQLARVRVDARSAIRRGPGPMANSLVGGVIDGMTDTAAADLARAEGLIGQALATSPRNAFVHLAKGRLLRAQNRWEEAVPEFEMALALNRNLVWALHFLAQCKLFAGSIEEVIPLEEQAIRLSPRDPRIGWWYFTI